jgi:hypothetical protein
MKDLPVAKAIDIKFERLEFDAKFIGYVANMDYGKIRKSAARTKTSEFGASKIDFIAPHESPVFKPLQTSFFNGQFSVQLHVFSGHP